MSLSSLPVELLLLILSYLQYASDCNALSQTSRLFHALFNPLLYSTFANNCVPNMLRLVKNRNLDALRKLLSCGYRPFDCLELVRDSPDWTNEETIDMQLRSKSLLFIAARCDDVETVRILLNALPEMTQSSLRSYQLLAYAASHGHLNLVKFLIDRGVPTEFASDKRGKVISILECAVTAGQLHVVKYLIEEVNCNVRHGRSAGWTLTRTAACTGHLAILEYLIEEAGCESTPSSSWRNLMLATAKGHSDVVKYLVKRGADPTHGDPTNGAGEVGETAFERALRYGHRDIILFFLEVAAPDYLKALSILIFHSILDPPGEGFSANTWISLAHKMDISNIILDRVDVEVELANADPSLHTEWLAVAAKTGNAALVKRLLSIGCSPQIFKMPTTPMSLAIQCGHKEVIEQFIQCPAYSISGLDVCSAAGKGQIHVVQMLLRKVEDRDFLKLAELALRIACEANKLILAIAQVFQGFSRQDVDTVIFMAMNSTDRTGQVEVTKFLLRKGSKQSSDEIQMTEDILARHLKKRTSLLEQAAAFGTVEQFQAALVEWNLQLDPKDTDCQTALVAAALGKNAGTIRLFLDRGFQAGIPYPVHSKYFHLPYLVTNLVVDPKWGPIDFPDDYNQARGRKFQPEEPYLGQTRPLESVQLLVSRGAQINDIADGQLPLIQATRRNLLSMTEQLLDLGADPLLKTPKARSALELAIFQGQTKFVKAFLKAIENRGFSCEKVLQLIPKALPFERLPKRGLLRPTDEVATVNPLDEITHAPSLGRSGSNHLSADNISLRDVGVPIWSAEEEDESVKDARWARFFIVKAMTQLYWRSVYPVRD